MACENFSLCHKWFSSHHCIVGHVCHMGGASCRVGGDVCHMGGDVCHMGDVMWVGMFVT